MWRMKKRARLDHEAEAAKCTVVVEQEAEAAKATVVVDLVDGAADSHLKQPKIARFFKSGAPT